MCPKDCPNRCAIPNCHNTCDNYLKELRERNAKREKILKAKTIDTQADSFRIEQTMLIRKKKARER